MPPQELDIELPVEVDGSGASTSDPRNSPADAGQHKAASSGSHVTHRLKQVTSGKLTHSWLFAARPKREVEPRKLGSTRSPRSRGSVNLDAALIERLTI